ncbi:hypothetical protein EHO59_11215 [Leptospira semungkisensis]|uniref:Transporter n=1 Tax=Leptospira semungkisensis TaxID=2484985 RepID=A0A4R9FT93_9LEPT|nr:hypothetical protein [Leptospira semungkisensis]TGK01675.1 hypothetical protein EHO59_11215 [Leptospira semungkisensis]
MKSLYTILLSFGLLSIFSTGELLAAPSFVSSGKNAYLPYPVWGQSIGVYNIIVMNADAADYSRSPDYERTRTASLNGELKLGNYFSVSGGYGYVDQYATKATSWSGWDRWKAGLKSFYRFGILSIGAGVSVYGPAVSQPWTGERNPNWLLLRPQVGFALDFGKTKFQAYGLYERETDSHFQDPIQDKFYRYMEAGATLSYETDWRVILLLETTYRAAVEGTISQRSDAFNLHPGVQILVGENSRIAISALFGLRENNTYDRGIRIGYQYILPLDE